MTKKLRLVLLLSLAACRVFGAVGPEIGVQQPVGTDLVDGATTIDFGNQSLNVSSAAKTFVITNSGLLNLNVTNVNVDAGDFIADTSGMLSTVAPGGSTTFTVRFQPTAYGARTSAIHIINNDANENPFDINLTGTSLDYAITTTNNAVVVTDVGGASDIMTVSEPTAGNINFAAAGRTFSINGGAVSSDSSGSISLTGMNSVTVNATADVLNLGAFTNTLPSLTVNASAFNSGAIGLQTNKALTINITSASAITGIVSGASVTLTKGGTGTLTLSNANTYSGATFINQGIVKIGHANAFGSPAAGTTLSDGATLDLNGITITEPMTLNGVGVGSIGAVINSVSGTARLNGTNTLATDTTIAVTNGVIEIQSKVTGPGGITKLGNGYLTLGATNNDYAGVTTLNAGILTMIQNGVLGATTGKTVVNSSTKLNFQLSVNNSYTTPEPVDLNSGGTITATFTPQTFTGPITLTGAATLDANSGGLTLSGVIDGNGSVNKTGTNVLTLNGTNTYTGATTNTGGTLLVNGLLSEGGGMVLIKSPSILGGTGTVSRVVSISSGGFVAPGASNSTPGILNTGDIVFTNGSTFRVDINGATLGTQYDQLNVAGTVTLSNATLSVTGTYVPAIDDSFVLINNDGNDPVLGTFNGLPEGATITINGVQKKITYIGGTGNDVVLLSPPEIAVQQPAGTNLVDGTASVGFGSVAIGDSANLIFTITNSGIGNLILTSITTDGTNAGDFSVGTPGSTVLPPATSTTFTVTFSPLGLGSRSATLHILNNDSDEGSFDINLTGTAFTTQVLNTNDNGPGSLRQVITDVNSGTTITFATNLSGSSIVLTNGQLLLGKNLAVDASTLPAGITIDGNTNSRIFQVNSGTTITLTNLTLDHGNGASGGAIYNSGVLTLIGCTLNSNVVPFGAVGGAIFSTGTNSSLTMVRCAVTSNQSLGGSSGGGGIFASVSTVLNGTNCIFSSNTSSNTAGAIHVINGAVATLANCTFNSNAALGSGTSGGAVRNTSATLTLLQCTLNGNSSGGDGGGVYSTGSAVTTLRQCTIVGNTSVTGGGGIRLGSGTITIENCIVAGNTGTAGPDIDQTGGTLTRVGDNIVGINTTVTAVFPSGSPNTNGDYVGIAASPVNSLLATLGSYGGPTQTMPPTPGSPAIDACTNGTSFTNDQRGALRVLGSAADIGAVEGVFNSNFLLGNPTLLGNNSVQVGFTNMSGAGFTILGSTNVALPLSLWSNLGPAVETPAASGQFQFIDVGTTNNPQRFYRVRLP